MLIVKLYGGLGNQMFQYAAARALASRHSIPLMYEGSYFKNKKKDETVWPYQLHLLNVECEQWVPALPDFLFKYFYRIIRRLNSAGLRIPNQFYFEKQGVYDKRLEELQAPKFIDGYFQSEKYFHNIRSLLLKEFIPSRSLSDSNNKILHTISSCESVSLHVRRGDYVSDSAAAKVHGTCDLSYYRTAADLISAKVSKPHFFLFSDDPEWVRNNLKIDGEMTVVDHNKGADSYLDMYLMSKCKHNITANSSFSWWGAWLNQNPSKIVIAPKKWFLTANSNSDAIVPESWVRV